jgi:hypothetical protein
MGRMVSNRKIAEALLKTLQHLEADPTVDPLDPAFIHLKSALLERIIGLQVSTAEIQSSIHLVEQPEPPPAEAAAEHGSESAIA